MKAVLLIRYDGYDMSQVAVEAMKCQPVHGSLLDRERHHLGYLLAPCNPILKHKP